MNIIVIALSGFIFGVSAPYIFKASLQGFQAWGLM